MAANSPPIEAATWSVCDAAVVANWDTGSTAAFLTIANWSGTGGVVPTVDGWLPLRAVTGAVVGEAAAGAIAGGAVGGVADAIAWSGVVAAAGVAGAVAGAATLSGVAAGAGADTLVELSFELGEDLPQPLQRNAATATIPEITIVRFIGP